MGSAVFRMVKSADSPLKTPSVATTTAAMRTTASIAVVGSLLLAAPAAAAPATVGVNNDRFTPKSVTIDAGESVTWAFGEGGHNVDVYDGPETFKSTSGKNANGTTFAHAFAKAGTYSYVCDYHGSMTGTVVVNAPAPAPAPVPVPNPAPAPKPTPAPTTAPKPVTSPTGITQPLAAVTPGAKTVATPAASPATADAQASDPAAAEGTAAAAPAGSPAAAAADGAAPALRALGFRRNRLRLRLSEGSRLVVRFVRIDAGAHRVHKRIVRARKRTARLHIKRWMRAGRYRITVVAYDARGNMSKPLRLRVSVRRQPSRSAR